MKELTNLVKSYDEYCEAVEAMERKIRDKVEFEFAIDHQSSDGHTFIND